MKRREFLIGAAAATAGASLVPKMAEAFPTVYPHGTTIYKPEKCYSGYTVFGTESRGEGSVLIDMNGNIVKQWHEMSNVEHPVKILKGGYIMGATNQKPEMVGRTYGHEMSADLSIMDYTGKIVRNIPLAGMHHDFQVPGNPVGYHAPGMDVNFDPNANITVLSHLFTESAPHISPRGPFDDDYIYEVDKNNNIVWDWLASDYFHQMKLTPKMKESMKNNPNFIVTRTPGIKAGDWIHTNSMSYLGPNKWYDQDPVKYKAFHPENIIICNRQLDTVCIIEKATKNIVWEIGPEFTREHVWEFGGERYTRALSRLGQIVGPHHAHMIPKGLPGEGDIMIYDNGGFSGYGDNTPTSPTGIHTNRRDYSRVIQFNPETLSKTWEHSAAAMGLLDAYRFYSDYVSCAQRLPNGNTLITNGAVGQLQEVTPENEIVWEYISPWYNQNGKFNLIYRAYRVPYDYVPQAKKPKEKKVTPPDNATWRIK